MKTNLSEASSSFQASGPRIICHISRILSVVTKLVAVYFAIAIGLGRMSRESEFTNHAAKNDIQPIRIERVDNLFRIMTQLLPGEDGLRLELVDPRGQKHLFTLYDCNGTPVCFAQETAGMKLGCIRMPGGGESLHLTMPKAKYSLQLQANGQSSVCVVDPANAQHILGEIAISPGENQSPTPGNSSRVP